MACAPSRDIIGPILEDLLACGYASLCDSNREPGLSFLAPGGDVAYDNCCEGAGQLWVRLIEMYPTGPFPSRDTRPRCAPTLWGARIGLGVIRCAHTVDANGTPPTADQMTGDTLGMTADASALRDALLCCFVNSTRNVDAWSIENWLPQGPQGGCVGGEWTIVIGFGTCACPEPVE